MVSTVQRLVGNHTLVTSAIAGELVNKQHSDILDSREWSRKKTGVILSTVTDKTAGTVTLTNGAATIAGSGTAWAASDTGKSVLIADSLYVFTYVGATAGTLADENGTPLVYSGATAASLSYVMFKRFYSLGYGIDSILTMKHEARIYERDQEFFDNMDPSRSSTGGTPLYFARGPRDQTGTNDLVQIEFMPRVSAAITINAGVLKGHIDLAGTQNPIVPSGPVEWFAAQHAALYLFAKTKEAKWLTLSNEFEKKGAAALEREGNMDDKKFGRSPAVKDTGGGTGLRGTDFELQHDLGV